MSLTRKKVVCNEAGHPVDEQGVETDDPSTYAYTPDLNEDKTSWSKTETLTNFSAEFMSQTASFGGLAQYDERGLPYRYNISETGVRTKIGEEYQPVDLEKAEGHFVTQDGYRYRQVTEVQDDGSILVKNILVGNAEVNITKTFPDGIVGGTTTITYGIYQDGVKIGTVTKVYTDESGKGDYTYNADAPDHSVNKYVSSDRGTDVLVSTYSQLGDRPDPVPSEGLLPRYDSKDGHEYQYTITEDAVNPPAYEKDNEISFSQNDSVYTDANPDYKDEHYLRVQAGVSNPVVGPGGESILVKKAWIDDFDMACRQSVVVGLVDSTGAVVEYGADEGDKAGKQAIGTISPSQDRVRIAVPKRLKAADLTVRELTVGESSVVQSGNSPLTDVDWIKNHPGFVAGHGWVMTTQHEYDVSVKNPTDSKDSDGAWVVTNRRIGVLEIDITKKWVDGSDVQGKRPGELTFTISNDENKNPFVGADGNPTNSLDVTLTKDGNAVDGDSNTWAAIEGLLLKYDKIDGSILHYTIEEKTDWIATSGADYVMSKQHDGYFIGDVHTNDKDKYTFTNALAKSVVPTINKFWKDD
ncbi:MAG: Cna B-type domain-containing protein, partial [Bacteroides sp.]